MIGIVATLKVKAGEGSKFEDVFKKLMAQVRANEPGNIVYQLTKSRAEPDTYKVLEIYKDEDALGAHRGSDHFRSLGREMGAFMDGRPDIELLDGVE